MGEQTQTVHAVDPASKSCRCYGAPIDVVWQDRVEWVQAGFRCGRCGQTWKHDHAD